MGVLQTNQRELDAFYAMALPGFLEYLRTHGTSVGDVELATTLEGITSLPARYVLGGVEKTVLAPLSLLTKEVDAQIIACVAATNSANTAASEANAAAKKVTDAITDITTQKQAALDAAASANAAATAATNARVTCESATQACKEATEYCRTKTTECVDVIASCRAATQECANETANSKVATVAANTAAAKANSESTNLSALKNACQDVTTRCESTNQTAEEKVVEMDTLMKNFSGESQASPVRMVVAAPSVISTANKVAQKIGVQLYPGYVMKNVLYRKEEGDSLRVDPSGNLKVSGTGTSSFFVIPTQNTELWQEVEITVRTPLIRLTGAGKIRLNGGKMRLV